MAFGKTAGPCVSVLIDTYNYGHFIEEAVESVLAQDFPEREREIVVVDDGSTDDTPERLKKFGQAITYLRKPNGGQASAFNLGFGFARGKYVALLDADDYWLPEKLTRIVEAFERHPDAGMVYHGFRQLNSTSGHFRDGGLPLVSGFLPASPKDLLRYVLYPTSFLAFRRSAIDLLLPIPERLTIQADAHLSGLVVFVAPVVSVPDRLAVYRVHDTNLFADAGKTDQRRRELRIQTRTALIEGMKCWLEERGYELERPDLKALFKQWELTQEGDAFELETPNRFTAARHLMQYASYYSPRMTWRHRTATYMNAAGSLVVGYKNIHKLDEWRTAITHAFRERPKLL
jgi:glycosyltransferase involved in cell wall biosynthesis